MRFTKDDFKNLKYPVLHLAPSARLRESFPELKKYPEFNGHKLKQIDDNSERVIIYAFLMYSDNNPLDTLSSIEMKKVTAAEMAGFTRGRNNKFNDKVERMITNQDTAFNEMAIRVCQLHRNHTFTKLKAYNQTYYREITELMNGESKDPDESRKLINALEKDIKEAQAELLHHDSTKNLIETLYDVIDAESLGITAEELVNLKKQGQKTFKKVLPDPYA